MNEDAAGGRPSFRAAGPAQVERADAAAPPEAGSNIRPYLTESDMKAKRRPEPVGDIVDRLMTGIGGGAAPGAALGARWADVVGADFAARTAPGSCESGRLVILVADGSTASKMRFHTSQILRSAGEIVGAGVITAISFRVSPSIGGIPTT